MYENVKEMIFKVKVSCIKTKSTFTGTKSTSKCNSWPPTTALLQTIPSLRRCHSFYAICLNFIWMTENLMTQTKLHIKMNVSQMLPGHKEPWNKCWQWPTIKKQNFLNPYLNPKLCEKSWVWMWACDAKALTLYSFHFYKHILVSFVVSTHSLRQRELVFSL